MCVQRERERERETILSDTVGMHSCTDVVILAIPAQSVSNHLKSKHA